MTMDVRSCGAPSLRTRRTPSRAYSKEGDRVTCAWDEAQGEVVLTATPAASKDVTANDAPKAAAEERSEARLDDSFPASDPPAFIEHGPAH